MRARVTLGKGPVKARGVNQTLAEMKMLRSLKFLTHPVALVLAVAAAFAAAQLWPVPVAAAQLKLHTNQQMIEDLLEAQDLDISNPDAVFEAVFQALPAKVTVYPTESYYYFTFPCKGIIYAGNLRFDAWDQFDGKVHFAYFPESTYWSEPQTPAYKKFGPNDGVLVTQADKFHYKIEFKGKSVGFELPDLSNIRPSPDMIRADETYIGPIWDESGVQFFLVFNKSAKTFLYLLNDKPKMDRYEPSEISPAVTVGTRTSFAFYKDKLANRQILMGVFFGNTEVNNYFDGPFDQLPDNYIEGDTLLDALLSLEPAMKGKVDRYGSDPSGEVRYSITTYKYYRDVEDLKPIVDCAEKAADPAQHYACFNVKQEGEDEEPGGGPAEGEKAKEDNSTAPRNP